jgi:CubicO group peptidase (beta-lactamase class C family)
VRAASVCVLLCGVASACGGSGNPSEPSPPPVAALTPVAATEEWPSATPESEGLDIAPLVDLVSRIHRRDYGAIDSLLVVRNGRLIVEEYFNGWSAERTHTQQSVSKSVTSLLVGLAIDAGRLRLDDRVASFFPSYEPVANLDDRKRAMTVRDLLTMRSGFDWSESTYAGSPLQRMNECGCDWLRFVLDWPMREPPGSRWEYISGSTILLGGIVGAATGQRIDRFAQDRLFAPLGVTGASWFEGLPDGLPHTGGGLYLRPRDMAKIGALVASGGRWRGAQIVSAGWVRESTAPVVSRPRTFGSYPTDYGYHWWMLDGGVVVASGALGQWIFISPEQNLVVSTTANNQGGDTARAIEFFYTTRAAVRR